MSTEQISPDRNLLNTKNEATERHRLLTEREAADFLRVSTITLWRLRKAGKIAFIRISSRIVYRIEDLNALVESSRREAFGAPR